VQGAITIKIKSLMRRGLSKQKCL